MAVAQVSELVELLESRPLLSSTQTQQLRADLQRRYKEPRGLARDLLQRGWLTAYQLNQIFQDRTADLFVDQYVLLERLGEGGMGQVYKARHLRMERLVALKLLRPERVDNPEAVKRFYREVQAAAQLSHPNIVTAYDAGEARGTYFFAMEYIDGPDLGKLIKDSGPLPIALATAYVRDVAFGLQHAFEKGMVHRDIKPSNLLLTSRKETTLRGPHFLRTNGAARSEPSLLVKILDMGLARLNPALQADAGGTLTQAQVVLGTPDFIAPEQARSSHTADIRSDLYSLGCTFYYLLTGRVPFPVDVPMEKLLKHFLEEPTPVEEIRPEVPGHVVCLIRRLMAKDPAQRFQTPSALVNALESRRSIPMASLVTLPTEPSPSAVGDRVSTSEEVTLSETLPEVLAMTDNHRTLVGVQETRSRPRGMRSPKQRGRAARLLVMALVFLLTTALLFTLLRFGLR